MSVRWTCCALVAGLLVGCNDAEEPDGEPGDIPGQVEPEISFRVVDSATGGPLDAPVMQITHEVVHPASRSGDATSEEVSTAGPYTIAEGVAGDSLVVEVRVSAEGYRESGSLRFTAGSGERLRNLRIPLARETGLAIPDEPVGPTPPPIAGGSGIKPPPVPPPGPAGGGSQPQGSGQRNMAKVVFETQPSGARVRLRSREGGGVYEDVTPFELAVPAGVYAWEVELDGYLPDQSRDRDLNLLVDRSQKISRALVPAGDWQSMSERADAAFQAGRCAEAVRLYTALSRPKQMDGTLGLQYAESRMKLAQCQQRQRDFDAAIKSYSELLSLKPQWTAKYQLGRLYCDINDFGKGRAHLRELEGPFLGNVDASRKSTVQALATYGLAGCLYREYTTKENPERYEELRGSALTRLEEFIVGGERLVERRRVPGDLAAEVNGALADARTKRNELQSQ